VWGVVCKTSRLLGDSSFSSCLTFHWILRGFPRRFLDFDWMLTFVVNVSRTFCLLVVDSGSFIHPSSVPSLTFAVNQRRTVSLCLHIDQLSSSLNHCSVTIWELQALCLCLGRSRLAHSFCFAGLNKVVRTAPSYCGNSSLRAGQIMESDSATHTYFSVAVCTRAHLHWALRGLHNEFLIYIESPGFLSRRVLDFYWLLYFPFHSPLNQCP
jgi:hypothetical protein